MFDRTLSQSTISMALFVSISINRMDSIHSKWISFEWGLNEPPNREELNWICFSLFLSLDLLQMICRSIFLPNEQSKQKHFVFEQQFFIYQTHLFSHSCCSSAAWLLLVPSYCYHTATILLSKLLSNRYLEQIAILANSVWPDSGEFPRSRRRMEFAVCLKRSARSHSGKPRGSLKLTRIDWIRFASSNPNQDQISMQTVSTFRQPAFFS